MFGEIRVLEKREMIVGPRGGDRVPHTCEGVLAVLGLEHDLEDHLVVRCPDLGVG
jgi:hypothetical protein